MLSPEKGTVEKSVAGVLKMLINSRGAIREADIALAAKKICQELQSWENNNRIVEDRTIILDKWELQAVIENPNTKVIVAGKWLLDGRVYVYPELYDYKKRGVC